MCIRDRYNPTIAIKGNNNSTNTKIELGALNLSYIGTNLINKSDNGIKLLPQAKNTERIEAPRIQYRYFFHPKKNPKIAKNMTTAP